IESYYLIALYDDGVLLSIPIRISGFEKDRDRNNAFPNYSIYLAHQTKVQMKNGDFDSVALAINAARAIAHDKWKGKKRSAMRDIVKYLKQYNLL
ncbi:MAG: hypothetical protein D6712_21030, partial [Chloroflexi bacterium]